MSMAEIARMILPGLLGSAALAMCAAHAQPGPARPHDSSSASSGALIHEADLNVPIADVWEAFTTDEGMRKLGVAQAKVDLRLGGKILSHHDPIGIIGDEGTIENTIIAYEPMRMLAFRITRPPKGFPFMEAYKSAWSVVSLTDLGGGRTHLRIAMMGYGADEESRGMRAFFDQGNAWVMRHLREALEGNAGAAGVPTSSTSSDARPSPGVEAPASPAGDTPASPAAEMPPSDPLAPVATEAVIAAPVAEVWRCWTTSEGIRGFLTDAKVELRIGGPFELYFDKEAPEGMRGSEGCVILSYEPTDMLSFSWNAPPRFANARGKHTWVVVRIDPYGAHSSRVMLRHMGFAERVAVDPTHREEWTEVRAYFQRAWPSVLQALREHFQATAKP